MSKKKILSILIISLMVLGTIMFVVNNIQAKPKIDSGTCCDEWRSTCVIGTYHREDAYRKAEGSCN